MDWQFALIPLLIALSQAVVFLMLPGRGDVLFWHPVEPGYSRSEAARALVSRYRLGIVVLAVLAGAAGVYALSAHSAGLLVAATMLQVAGGLLLYHRAKSHVVATSGERPSPGVRTASLISEPLLPAWGWILFVLPPLILAWAAFYLQLNWDQIPERFPVHWGIDGKPDRWNTKSFKGVYGILMIAVSTMVLLYGTAAMILSGTPRGAGPESSARRLLRAAALSMGGAGVFVAVLMSWIAIHPLLGDPGRPSSPLPVIVVAVGGGTALAVWMLHLAQGAAGESAATPDSGWKLMDLIYYNREDPAMMVPRRVGAGLTPNFAHPTVKFAMPLLLLQMFAVIQFVAR